MNIAATEYGKFQGIVCDGYTVFKGIPYAKPPVGALRFAPPQKPDRFDGVCHADHFSHRGPSTPPMGFYEKEFAYARKEYFTEPSEDCLYLNIWTPAEEPGEKLPVAFWIHGGAFVNGCGSEIEFDGEAYCQKGVILVTINYRLGALGFLAHPWLAEEQGGHCGNYGLLDQIAALEWVKDNISAFGGDPDRITIFGQSAGAMSVHHLISTDLTKEMIFAAILQSGGTYGTHLTKPRTMEDAFTGGDMFAEYLGVGSLEELRAVSPERLEEAKLYVFQKSMEQGMMPFGPAVDGYVLKEPLDETAKNGRLKKINYMLGYTTNDLLKYEELVVMDGDGPDPGPIAPATQELARMAEQNGVSSAYVYCFAHKPLGDSAGAFHSSELWYMFGTLDRSWRPKTEEDYALSDVMITYWTNFMKTGSPNRPEQPRTEWKRFQPGDPDTVMVFR